MFTETESISFVITLFVNGRSSKCSGTSSKEQVFAWLKPLHTTKCSIR